MWGERKETEGERERERELEDMKQTQNMLAQSYCYCGCRDPWSEIFPYLVSGPNLPLLSLGFKIPKRVPQSGRFCNNPTGPKEILLNEGPPVFLLVLHRGLIPYLSLFLAHSFFTSTLLPCCLKHAILLEDGAVGIALILRITLPRMVRCATGRTVCSNTLLV